MQTRNTVIMAVVLVLLGAFVYFYEIRGKEAREEAERQAELLLHFDVDQVKRIAVTTDEGTVVATKGEEEWQIVEPVTTAADGTAIDALVDRLHEAKREREIVEAAEDLAPFGLASPALEVELGLADGSTLTLSLGKDTPVGFNAYATTDGSAVVAVTRSLKSSLDKKLLDLRDRAALHFDEAEIRSIEIERGGLRAVLQAEPRADEEEVELQWTALEPFAGRADGETVDDLLASLHDAEAKAFVLDAAPTPEQLAAYGLDHPYARITLRTEDEATHTLLVGGESEEPAGRYAMREGGTSVFVVGDDLLEDLPSRAEQLRNKQVLELDRTRVAALEIEHDDTALRLVRDDSDWRIERPRPLDADASAVSRLLSALEDLRAEGFAARPPRQPELTVRVELAPETPAEQEGAEQEGTGGDQQAGEAGGADNASAATAPSGGPGHTASQAGTAAHIVLLTAGGTVQRVPLSDADDEAAEAVAMRPVQVTGDPTVYLVEQDDLEDLFADLFAVRKKTLVQFTQSDLTALEIEAGQERWQLRKDGDEWRAEGGEAPGEKVSDLLWDLNFLRMESVATEWTDTPPPLDAWGLDAPRYRIVARTADGVAAEVAIGDEAPAKEEGGSQRVWVTVAGHRGVFAVAASLADTVEELVEALRGS